MQCGDVSMVLQAMLSLACCCHCCSCVMGPSAFERHAGAGSSKKWKASCRVADPESQQHGRPVVTWLQQQGYEQTAGERAAAAAGDEDSLAAAAAAGLTAAVRRGAGKQQQQHYVDVQQRWKLLRRLKLLLSGVPLMHLAVDSGSTDSEIQQRTGSSNSTDTLHGASLDGSSQAAAAAAASYGGWLPSSSQSCLQGTDLPLQLPASCFSEAWQLPSSTYFVLPAVQAALKVKSSSGTTAGSTGGKAVQQQRGAGPGGARVQGSVAAYGPGGGGGGRAKRARVLKDGALTLIPYGHDESLLWMQRVHSFIAAARWEECRNVA